MEQVTAADVERTFQLIKALSQGNDTTPLVDIANNQIMSGKINVQGLLNLATNLGADNLLVIELAGLLRKLAFAKVMIPNFDFKPFSGLDWPTGIQGPDYMVEIEEWVTDGQGGGSWIKVRR